VVLNAIKTLSPKADCYLHQSGKFLYIRGDITLEQIWKVVEPLAGVDIAMYDNLQIHEEKIRYHVAKALEYSQALNISEKVEVYTKALASLPLEIVEEE
jgi:hypothetical protein